MAWTTPGTATAGEVLTASFWNTNVRDNTNALYQSAKLLGVVRDTTGTTNITQTTLSTDFFSSDLTFTADGTSTYIVEIRFGLLRSAAVANEVMEGILVDGSGTQIASLIYLQAQSSGTVNWVPGYFTRYEYTPASGSRSLNFRFRTGSGTAQVWAYGGNHIKVYGPDIT